MTDRDHNGRFVNGNSGGPGRPRGSATALTKHKAALQEAATADRMRAIVETLIEQAIAGCTTSAKIVLERVMGRPRQEASDPASLGVDLGEMRTAADCLRASSAVFAAMSRAELSSADALTFANVIETVRRAVETHEIEQRVAALEEVRQ